MFQVFLQFGWLDSLAISVFMLCWAGYGYVADHARGWRHRGLQHKMHEYRTLWAIELVKRNNRVADTALLGNLARSVSFYANTTIYILAALFALLGALDQVMSLATGLPFGAKISKGMMEIKVFLVLAVFVFAYFKFTWSLRQFSLLSMMVGGAPEWGKADELYVQDYIHKLAAVNTLAGDEFNRGLRAYYFAIALVTWAMHPALLMASSGVIVWVLFKRDFGSEAVRVLSAPPSESVR